MVCDGLPQRQRRAAFCGGRPAEVELGTLEKQPLKERLIWRWSCLQLVSLWVWSCFTFEYRIIRFWDLLSTSWISRDGSTLSFCCWRKLWLSTVVHGLCISDSFHSSFVDIYQHIYVDISWYMYYTYIHTNNSYPSSKKGSPSCLLHHFLIFSSSHGNPRTNSLASSSSKILPSASHEKRSPSWWTMCSVALGVGLGHACDLAFVEGGYNPKEWVETRNDSKHSTFWRSTCSTCFHQAKRFPNVAVRVELKQKWWSSWKC